MVRAHASDKCRIQVDHSRRARLGGCSKDIHQEENGGSIALIQTLSRSELEHHSTSVVRTLKPQLGLNCKPVLEPTYPLNPTPNPSSPTHGHQAQNLKPCTLQARELSTKPLGYATSEAAQPWQLKNWRMVSPGTMSLDRGQVTCKSGQEVMQMVSVFVKESGYKARIEGSMDCRR